MTGRHLGLAAGLCAGLASPVAAGYEISPNVAITGNAQVWLTAYEEMEDLEGLYQHPSGDEATTITSGFRINTARLALKLQTDEQDLSLVTRLRLEDAPGLLDLYGRYQPVPWFGIRLGQFKVPSLYENQLYARHLDFVTRSRLASALADYSLSRTTHASSLFHGNRSFQRDLGLALEGEVLAELLPIRYVAMVGNGLGGGLFVGGNTKPEYVIANAPGHWFYAGRLEIEPVPGVVTIGGHGSTNHHGDVVFNSGRAVLDVKRFSASGDVQLTAERVGLRGAAAFGGGDILDDWDDDGRVDFTYYGAEWRAFWCLNPALRGLTGWPRTDDHQVELGFRYDTLVSEQDESGAELRQSTYTPAATYRYLELVKVQLNWLVRRTEQPYVPELADDAVILAVQAAL